MSAENKFDAISGSMCKLVACFCVEYGCAAPMDPCILADSKFLCCKGYGDSAHDIGGPKGMINSIDKCLCCVRGCGMPLVCTVCNSDIIGTPQRAMQETDDQWVTEVFWLAHCICSGCGFAGISPLCHSDEKLFCLESHSRTTEICNDEGCVHSRQKVCCIVNACECPPTMDIGMACCGVKLVGGTPSTTN